MDFLSVTIGFSTFMAIIPVSILLWNHKKLFQSRFGWGVFGIYTGHLITAILSHILAYLFKNAFPAFHLYSVILCFSYLAMFWDKITNSKLKAIVTFLFLSMLTAEFLDLIFLSGFYGDNMVSYSFIQLSFVIFYFMYLYDVFYHNPISIFSSRTDFAIISLNFVFAIQQLLFSSIEYDIRFYLDNQYLAQIIWATFVWIYILYLIISAFVLWKNLRSLAN